MLPRVIEVGTSLASVQVRLNRDNASARFRGKVIKVLKSYVLRGSFIETSEDPDCDRAIFIGPLKKQIPWLTILDTNGNMRDLAGHLSKALKGTAVFINLIDSDVVHLRRYVSGSIIDDYCNAPEMYDSYTSDSNWLSDWDELDDNQLQLLKSGDVSKWQDLFVEGTNTIDLQNIWNSTPVFADDILWATVNSLGMNDQEIFSMGRDETFTRLTFRLKEPRLYEIKAEGVPKLDLHSYGILREIFRGDDIDIHISIRNDGGVGAGLNIIAWGSALDKKILSLGQARMYKGAKKDTETKIEGTFIFQNGSLENRDLPMYVVSLPDFEIPAGIAGGVNSQSQPGVDWYKAFEALNHTLLHVRLLGKVEAEGEGNLFVGFVPLDNKRDGYVVYQASLLAKPSPRKPLRYRNVHRPVPSTHLNDLENPSHLFVLVSLGAELQQGANIAGNLIEAWVGKKSAKPTDIVVAHLRTKVNLMPDEIKFLARQIPSGAKWRKIWKSLGESVSLSVAHESASVHYDTDPLFFQNSVEKLTPHITFFLPLENRSIEELIGWEEWFTKIVNDLMERKLVVQALLGRWRWRGQQIDLTPYETATGIGGQCTTAQFWCKRFLRGVTERLWLGPDLVQRLGAIEQLAPISEVMKISNGVSIRLNEEYSLSDLEHVLAPLLPSEQDWREAVQRLYPRNNTHSEE
ncbi:MAG TPA: hypothetical protein VFR47_29340 [Anaerolineales bacterium]|nr:hypothetical protein [Anaerolineales bacterium]